MKRLLFLKGALRILHFAVSIILSCRSLYPSRFWYQKSWAFWFWCPLRFAVSVLFRSSGKNKIGFLDLLFGDAVWCCFGFSSYNMGLNDLNRVHCFSDFACGFWLSSKFISVLRFSVIFFVRSCGL